MTADLSTSVDTMPEKYSPTPDDVRPAHSEFNTSDDDFLNDLGERMENTPLSPKEMEGVRDANAYRHMLSMDRPQSGAESYEQTLDRLDMKIGALVESEQMEKLSEEGRQRLQELRSSYERIGKRVFEKTGSEELVQASDEARRAWHELHDEYRLFVEGGEVREFEAAIQETLVILHGVEEKLNHLQDQG